MQKIPSVRKTLESVGTSIKVIQQKWGGSAAGPTPEELKNYMDVSSIPQKKIAMHLDLSMIF